MKTKVLFVSILFVCSLSVSAQYSLSVNYGNVDWIPKSNKVLIYENIFILQSFTFGKSGLSIWEANCLTKAPNSYELAGIDYVYQFGKVKTRVGFHGYFSKETMTKYNDKGNLIPNIGISMCGVTVNVYQFWNYELSEQFLISNVVYKKTFEFGCVEAGQYYNFKTKSLSGSVAYSKSWVIYKKISGFASIRCSFNESKVKLNQEGFVVVNLGIKI